MSMPAHRSVFLMAAFAALLGVIALASWAVWRNARQIQAQTEVIHSADRHIQEALNSIRSGVYATAILTRDYLIAPDPAGKTEYKDQFREIRMQTESALAAVQSEARDEARQAALAYLREEIDAYWASTQVVFDWNARERDREHMEMLRKRMLRRQQIFALTERLEQLTSGTSAQERERIEVADRDFQASLGWIAGAALLLGVAISAFTVSRMRKLERQSLAAETELRSLSAQLRTAQEEERKYLSRELHDQVGQMLTGLRMELNAVSRLEGNPESEVSTRLARARGTVEQTLGIVRDIAMLLRPSMLDDLGLTPALNWLVKEMSRTSGLDLRAEIAKGVDDLPDAHRTCLFRVVQEALTNAVRHSGAASVGLKVDLTGPWIQASIKDDGKGFEADTERPKGLGLVGMEERVRELGGMVQVSSAPGRGTLIEVRLPRPAPRKDLTTDENLDSGRSRDRASRLKAVP
jgi:signal transduction histidine kinase